MTESTTADRCRELRRRCGMTQEELAEKAAVSIGCVRKLEQGGQVRMETLHAIARALGVVTVTFVAPASPEPTEESIDDNVLSDIRSAVAPPMDVSGHLLYGDADCEEPNLGRLRDAVQRAAVAYHADRYDDLAAWLPALVRSARFHVDAAPEDQRRDAVRTRSDALSIAGRYLIQIRAHDLSLTALNASLADAVAIGDVPRAAAAVSIQAHAMLRQGRFDEVERLCVRTAEEVEPKISSASADELAAWGWMLMRASAAAARNNRPEEARDYLLSAAAAAARIGGEHTFAYTTFGPATVIFKQAENAVIGGHPDETLRLTEHLPGGLDTQTPEEWQRHRLDYACGLVRAGDADGATDVLTDLRHRSPWWLRYQQYARETIREILATRPRMPNEEQRALADFMNVEG
jgi:transcriptional regulator with XRE-family HTH domain